MAETWVIKSSAHGELVTTQIAFTSNGQKFTSIGANSNSDLFMILYYDNNEIAGYDPGTEQAYAFDNEAYRTITFDTAPTGNLLTWLQANGVKQIKPANKVVVNGETILDLTQDTVTPATLAKGIKAHDKSGAPIVGTMEASAGGDYNIAATTNADGTQNLSITDAAGGGSSGGSGVQWVPPTGSN